MNDDRVGTKPITDFSYELFLSPVTWNSFQVSPNINVSRIESRIRTFSVELCITDETDKISHVSYE